MGMNEGKKGRNKNLTIPNAISVLRIFIVPFFAYFFLKDEIVIAVSILLFSGLTDMVDGIIARKLGQITELGKMLDPLADKLTQVTVAICIGVKFPVLLPLLAVFFVKEISMLYGAAFLLKRKKKPCAARWFGKISTGLFYITMATIVVMDGILNLPESEFDLIANILLLVTVIMMIYSLVRYFLIFIEILKTDDEEFDITSEIMAKND